MATFCVIIPAAGKGERFSDREKKTFAKLDNRPVFIRTLERFITRKDVCQTILVVASDDMEIAKTKYGPNLSFMGVKIVEGGARRCDGVASALAQVSPDAEYVAVHDAARPCITDEWIDAVFAEAVKTGAAILAAPITGTLKRVAESKVIEETLSRRDLFEAQTPQVFRKDVIVAAYERLVEMKEEVTDDSCLVEAIGHPVAVVISDATNLKITTKGDMKLAAAILKTRPRKPVQRLGAFEEAQW